VNRQTARSSAHYYASVMLADSGPVTPKRQEAESRDDARNRTGYFRSFLAMTMRRIWLVPS
jgi:hypothetical protein